MGDRANARDALVEWLTDAQILGLDKVWPTYPRRWDFNDYGSPPHHCQAVVFIEQEGELRFALGGATSGKKRIDYLVSIDLFHRSTDPDPVVVMEDFDRILDEIKTRLRENRRLGSTESIIWQAGEGGYGIQCDFEPTDVLTGSEPTETRGRIRFEITQWRTT